MVVGIDTRPLRNRDDALRLQELVYTGYGLTYHRSFMYEPERLLDLNARGLIRSMIAVDSSSGVVIGHLGSIRPWFEMATTEEQLQPTTCVEMGLSIVHPDYRGQAVQGTMAMACVAHERAVNPALRSIFTKCLTRHLMSQKSSRRMGGRAGAMFLGGVPGWVIHDSERRPQPMTTLLMHVATTDHHGTAYLPPRWADVVREMLTGSNQNRDIVAVTPGSARPTGGASVVRSWFEPSRRRGVLNVRSGGADLVDAVMDKVHWMAGGHMEHITVLVPIDTPEVAAALPELEACGLFFGGYLPDIDGRDCVLMQWLDCDTLDIAAIDVIGDEAMLLRDVVSREWQRARALGLARPTGDSALAG